MNGDSHSAHVDDDALFAHIDGDTDDAAAAHIAACSECSARLTALRAELAQAEDALTALDVAYQLPPTLPPAVKTQARQRVLRRRAWSIAAAAVLVMALTLTVSPLRALIRQWLAPFWAPAGQSTEESVTPGTVTGPTAAPQSYQFRPQTADLRVVLRSAQQAGVLVVSMSGDTLATLSPDRAAAQDPVMILPDAVMLQNAAHHMGSYRLELPHSVSSVTVTVGNSRGVVIRTAELRGNRADTMSLSTGR